MFRGTWKLVDMSHVCNGVSVGKPFGESPPGYITYTEDNYMHAILMKTDRKSVGMPLDEFSRIKKPWGFFKLKFLKAALNYLRASSGFVAYSGFFEIKDDKIIHHVNSSFYPDWAGIDLVRKFKFEGDRLILSAEISDGSDIELTWEKINLNNK